MIIVAGGKGVRMNSDLPKPFIRIDGKTIMEMTLKAVSSSSLVSRIILVVNSGHRDLAEGVLSTLNTDLGIDVTEGGEFRFDSVRNGMALAKEDYIGIHDCARPYISPALIKTVAEEAFRTGAAVPGLRPSSTVKVVSPDREVLRTLSRHMVYEIQTPQIFRADILRDSYGRSDRKHAGIFTDDSSVVEKAGYAVKVVEGERENIKITYSKDLPKQKDV